ncbi:MAG TPA: DUF1116 domain-containing protein [Anaerolineales bacterium]|jgi:hypothetical protein
MMDTRQANQTAFERMMASQPRLVRVAPAGEVVPGLTGDLILHAGPPIAWDQMSGPLRGAIIGALLLEGRAQVEDEAAELAASGDIRFAPCHHHDAVGPMAGVLSPSMAVYVVEDSAGGQLTFSSLNEGYGKVLRYGAFAPEVIEKLRWMNRSMAPALSAALEQLGEVDLRALIAEALHMGDEGHNRNKAGSLLFLRTLAPVLAQVVADADEGNRILAFLGGNALSVLNPVMAACKAMTLAAHGVEGSSLVTVMARNGTDFGIRVSGLGDRWFVAPCEMPAGKYFEGYSQNDANPDIGDSTITETAGIGAFAMAAAPAIVEFISGTPELTMESTLEMYQITQGEHEHFNIPALGFRGTPTAIDAFKVVETGILPRINTGIAHREAGVGQIGAGLVRPPMAVFQEAAEALRTQGAQHHG